MLLGWIVLGMPLGMWQGLFSLDRFTSLRHVIWKWAPLLIVSNSTTLQENCARKTRLNVDKRIFFMWLKLPRTYCWRYTNMIRSGTSIWLEKYNCEKICACTIWCNVQKAYICTYVPSSTCVHNTNLNVRVLYHFFIFTFSKFKHL